MTNREARIRGIVNHVFLVSEKIRLILRFLFLIIQVKILIIIHVSLKRTLLIVYNLQAKKKFIIFKILELMTC